MNTTYYVNMTDKALSGWGDAKRGRSLYCVKCATRDQADAIVKAAEDRTEMKRIEISDKPRRARPGDALKIVEFDALGDLWKQYYRRPA